MKLNKLSFRVVEVEGEHIPNFSIELIIDDKPLGILFDTQDNKIPHWYVEEDLTANYLYSGEDLPSYYDNYKNKEIHLIGVCSCGESGCGCLGCVIKKDGDVVTFREIFNDGLEFPKDLEFKFSRDNYDAVVKEIVGRTNEYKKTVGETEAS